MLCNHSGRSPRDVILHPGTCMGIIQSELTFDEQDELVFIPSLPEIQQTIYQAINDT